MDKYNAFRIFIQVAEQKSFTRAAELLQLPRSSVTNAIQELEGLAKARLLNRTTRKVELSTEGISFVERCKEILSDIDEMESMFHSSPGKISGKIRIDMTSVAARDIVIPALPKFLEIYPEIEIEILGSDQRTDLIREGIDCSIRSGGVVDSRLVEIPIDLIPVVNIASPSYLKKYGVPKKIEDLKQHRLIQYVQNFSSEPETFDYFDGQKTHHVKMKSLLSVSNIEAYRAACLAGFGICQNPVMGVQDLLRSGKLIEILPKYQCPPALLKIVFPQRRYQAQRVKAFIDWVQPVIKKHLAEKRY